jgi:hypothetical protein
MLICDLYASYHLVQSRLPITERRFPREVTPALRLCRYGSQVKKPLALAKFRDTTAGGRAGLRAVSTCDSTRWLIEERQEGS